VTLLWNPATNRLSMAVEDAKDGDSFELAVEAADALDAFHHPYAYVSRSRHETLGSPGTLATCPARSTR
jgi:hypothetical protein